MKIVSVMTTASQGGAEFAAVEMLDALAERGHETVMLSNQPAIGRDSRVRVEPLELGPKLSRGSWRTLTVMSPRLLRDLARGLAAQAPYDALVLHYKKEQLLAALLPRRLRSTTVWCEWGPVPYQLRKGAPGRAYAAAVSRARVVMAVSEGTRRSIIEAGGDPERIHVVPNMMDVEGIRFSAQGRAEMRRSMAIPDDAFVVGCISRLHPKKRIDALVRAVVALGDPRVHLILAGSGETEPELRAVGAPLGERMHVIPSPTNGQSAVLSAFDVNVFCPSPTEGAPLAIILGMLAERASIAAGPEGARELISPEAGQILGSPEDVSGLAEAIRRVMDAPELAARQGRAGRAYAAATFARPIVADLVERLLIGASHRPAPGHPVGRR